MKKFVLIGMAISFLWTSQVFAALVFSEDFEGDLSAWVGAAGVEAAHNGQIVSGSGVLNFSAATAGGDMYTSSSFVAGDYLLEFKYKGTGTDPTGSGGFVGLTTAYPGSILQWLISENGIASSSADLTSDGSWDSYSVAFSAGSAFHLTFEDFNGEGGGIAGDAYYDDIDLSAVPVPAAVWLLGSGLLGLVGFRRKRNA